jgi:hypothetical protein
MIHADGAGRAALSQFLTTPLDFTDLRTIPGELSGDLGAGKANRINIASRYSGFISN